MGPVRTAVRWFLADLSREPSGERRFWLMAAVGGLSVALWAAGAVTEGFGIDGRLALLGVGLGAMGTAELLPPDRLRLARSLRVGTWVAFGLYAAWLVVPPVSAAGRGTQLVAVATLVVLVGIGIAAAATLSG